MFSTRCLSRVLCVALFGSSVCLGDYSDIYRIGISASGTLANAACVDPAIDSAGSFVAFSSAATNLVTSKDTNQSSDIFLRKLADGSVVRVSSSVGGFAGSGESSHAVLAGDGSVVVFDSTASDLTPTQDANGKRDIFAFLTATGGTTRLTQGLSGAEANGDSLNPSVNSTGSLVAFQSAATNLVNNDTNGKVDLFLVDRASGAIQLLSKNASGTASDGDSVSPALNADGSVVAFESSATNLLAAVDANGKSDVYLRNIGTGVTTLVSPKYGSADPANGNSSHPSISADGRYVVFDSEATNLVATEDKNLFHDVYLRDLQLGTTLRVSQGIANRESNGSSIRPHISADGSKVVFLSDATNLVVDDQNNTAGDSNLDVFVYDRVSAATNRVSTTFYGKQIVGTASSAAVNGTGKLFAFDYSESLDSTSISAPQLYVVDTNCTADRDIDGMINCQDACPDDATKTVGGTCGCGVSEVDSDGDGVLNCLDACASDQTKSGEGACGCGRTDLDSNGSGLADCLDPTKDTVPATPVLELNGRVLSVLIPSEFKGAKYVISVYRGQTLVTKKTTSRTQIKVTVRAKGAYRVRYRVLFGSVSTRLSAASRIRV